MKQLQAFTSKHAVWHRALALLLALSLVLIPVNFPNAAKAVGETATEAAPGGYFADNFTNDALLQGVTYKWNKVGSGNIAIVDGLMQVGKKDASGHNAVYLSATTGEGENLRDLSADWTDYTVTAVLDRTHVPASNYMGGILGRASKGADGKYSYYLVMVQGKLPSEAAAGDKLSVKLFKVVGANGVTQYVPNDPIAKMIGSAVNAGSAASTANEIKLSFVGDNIQCWVDGELAINYKDETDPVLSGTVGIYQQTDWQLDVKSFAVDFADGTNSFKDDFNDDRFMTGVTTKWDGSQVASYTRKINYQWQEFLNTGAVGAVTANGTYHFYATADATRSSWMILDSGEGETKPLDALTEYTIDLDYVRHNWRVDGGKNQDGYGCPWIVFGLQETGDAAKPYTGFGIKLHHSGPYIGKVAVNKNNYVTLAAAPDQTSMGGMSAGAEVWNHITLKVSGTSMEITLSNANKTGTVTWEHADLKPGKMGLIFERAAVDTTNKTQDANAPMGYEFDNFTVSAGGHQMFKDTFDNEDIFNGKVEQDYTISKNAPTAADVDFTWTEKLQNSSTADTTAEITAEGTYFCDPKNHSWLMANVASGSSKPMDGMTDYSISVDYVRHNIRGDGNNYGKDGYAAPYLLFGMQPIDGDASYIWKGYALKLHSGGPYCFEIKIKTNGQIESVNLGSQSGGSKAENWRNVKADVSGNTITVTLSDLSNNVLSSKTYQGSYAATGVFGLYSEFNKVDTVACGYEFDNLKVTKPDGTVFFEETFTLAGGQTKAAYLAATKTFEDVLESPSWYIGNGVLSGFSVGSVNMLASEFCGDVDYTKDWADYAIDADIMLSGESATAGFIANYNHGTYYEMRLSTSGVGLYLVTTTDETQLAYKALPLNANQWYLTKLEVSEDGKTLMGYIDSSLEIEAVLTDNALAKGTMGVVINGSAKFDNFAAYSVELSDSRIFKTYKFQGDDLAALSSDWIIESDKWELKNDTLVNKEAATTVLLKKATLDNYNAELRFIAAENTSAEVIGRYDSTAGTGYALGVTAENSIVLQKLNADGTRTSLDTATRQDLYELGLRLIPGQEYTLKLYMYKGQIWGFIDGIRLFAVKDDSYAKGVTAIAGTAGATVVTLATSEAFDVPELFLEDMQGNPVSGLTAYLGHTPDLRPYRVKAVYYDGTEKFADLDAIAMEGTFSTTDSGSVKFYYDFAELTVNYTVDKAEEAIAAIKAELDALDISALTLNNEAAVKDLVTRYNALSAVQKEASFTAEQRKKLTDAQEKIVVLRYPELADDPVVFRDSFDEYVPGKYVNDYLTLGARDPGEWVVENGQMYMYKNRKVYLPTSFTAYNELVKRNFEVKSISVDVQIIDEKAWAGINFNYKNGKFYAFTITDKSDRIQLAGGAKTTTIYANSTDLPESERLTFELGEWYNLRVTFDNGLIKCYVNDKLWIEYQDVPTIRTGDINTSGTVMLNASENWVKYDNLTIRGKELEWKASDNWYQINDNLPAGSYKDNFNDETVDADPSHWLELSHTDFWKVMADGENKVYGSTGTKELDSSSWLHVFETDVVYKTKMKVTELGHYPIAGLTARLNADTSYIKAGFDFTLNKWFIKTRYGADFAEVVTYGQAGTLTKDTWYDLKLDVEGTSIKLYCGDALVAEADAGKKVSPGRVGVFTEQCDIQIDDMDLVLTSGQGRVNDGVMEQYTAQAGATNGTLFNVLPLPDGRYLLNQDSTHYISNDDGNTWQPDSEYKSFRGNSQLILLNGKVLNVKYANLDVDGDGVKDDTSFTAYLSEDGGKTWKQVGTWSELNKKYSQPAEHLSEVILEDGTHRIFYTNNNQTASNDGVLSHQFVSDVFYSDDEGATWQRSVNSPLYTSNLTGFCESHVLKTKGALPGDPLVHYSTYNSSLTLRYSLSYDGGVTWEGDYAMPDIPCGYHSMTIEQDRETGIYYMATFSNVLSNATSGFPRLRVILLSSEDGFNWNFVADVDRWGDVSDADMGHIMQGVNMYLAVDKDYIFVSFSRSEAASESGSHQLQVGRLYRFDKTKLETYEKWPEELIINPNEIIYIEAKPANTYVAEGKKFDPTGSKLIVHHYDGSTTELDMSAAFVNQVVGPVGENLVYVDYKSFRDTFTVAEVPNEAPVVSGIENGKTYCESVTVTVTDTDIKSVTLNGQAVTLVDGKLTIAPASSQQTLIVTDQLGNVTTVKITVNNGHTGGTATCTDKAKCDVCGEAYGEKNADKHTKEAKWTITADKHSKAYECCGAVVVEEAAHTGGEATCEHKAKCEVCNAEYGKLADHKGGTATCTDKAKCDVCGEAYGEKNADKHTKEAKWTITADKHSKAYECCGKVVVAEEAHEWKDGKCQECGYEAAPGTEQKPIEIPADKETVKEEAKVEAGDELHYELDEKMAGMTITIKGEGAYAIIDGKKYEAVNGVLEVKLPAKTGKIPVIIGNAGTKAGTFSITIATPSEDNSDTGDNTAIVLLGSLMALSVLAAGVLLIPDIRKKLMK